MYDNYADYEDSYEDEENLHEAKIRLITFQLENETYAVEVGDVREILRINQTFPVPGAPDYVLGITNIRGNVVTIIDGRKRFNLPSTDFTDLTRMIVVEKQDESVAIVVDSVSDFIDVPESVIDSKPKVRINGDTRFISGVVTSSDELIIILNVGKYITEEQPDMAAGF